MGLETGSTISSFITSNPTSSDPVNQGDDHLRLIKSVLQAQFPGSGGLGYATAITTTEAELNALHGFTNIGFAAGTRLPFFNATAPTGWTQVTTYANHMLRVVATAGGGAGGTNSPILNNTSVPAHTHTFTGNALAAHTHTDSGHAHPRGASFRTSNGYQGNAANGGIDLPDTGTSFAVISSNSAGTPSGTNANNTAVSWTPQYVDMMICNKT
tara:strand:+ start:9867 stop:10505 length:639 start_codon:yes stop_codon:yes gene_type:complete